MARHEPTKTTITTPINAHTVELKDWITGRDVENINGAFFEGTKIKPTATGTVEFSNIDLSKTTEVTHKTIEAWVLSVDGVRDNILEDVLNMHRDDYQAVIQAIEELGKKK